MSLTEKGYKKRIIDSKIYSTVMGSDHCPIELDIEI